VADAGPWRGPTPPQGGTAFPFPQNRHGTRCISPTAYRNEDVQLAYAQWKTNNVTSDGAGGHLRVRRPNEPGLEPNSTVSEGIAYGMMIAVYMGDRMLFDELWKYEQMFLDDNGLMDWYILANMQRGPNGTGAATDADEDMAFALLMAHEQWGGQGTLEKPYMQHAREQIEKIWLHEVTDGRLANAGDHYPNPWDNINISYFAPAYYRLFKMANVPGADWDAVIKTVYDTIDIALHVDNGNATNGLVPAWCASRGARCEPRAGANYQYDSCRTPFRIAQDWCWFGEPRAKAYLDKTSAFFSAIPVTSIADGYALNGTPQPENPGERSAAFIGPAGVGAMSSAGYQTFVNQTYAAVATRTLLAGGTYYEESWTVMSLLMMTGNFIDLSAY
jgi:endo-1,4-beta-D-glucanase Y